MSVPTVDLNTLNPQLEIILRAGDIRQPNTREVLRQKATPISKVEKLAIIVKPLHRAVKIS
jgi:hypothetical protein